MDRRKRWKMFASNFDFVLSGLVLFCAILGIVVINSATHSLPSGNRDVLVQSVALILGIAIAALVVLIDYDYFKTLAWGFFGISVFILILVLFIGSGRSEVGTQGWIFIGPLSLQPAELAKIGFIISLSAHITKVKDELNHPFNILLLTMHLGVFLALMLLQNDWGTGMVFIFIFICMMLTAGIDWRYSLGSLGLFAISAPLLWFFVLQDFQKKRFFIFLNPEADPLDAGFQVIQSKIAIGSGRLLGNGYLQGTQTQLGHLPMARTDFIFGTIGEEFGFVGCLFVVILLMFIIGRCLYTAQATKSSFGELLCVGSAAMLCFHVLENICMSIGLMPVTGIPLPFFSYGGTNLITSLIAIGLVLNVSFRRRYSSF